MELALGARLVPIFNAESTAAIAEGLVFYTPQSPPGMSYEQYHEWVCNMQVPHHFDMDEGKVKVVGGLGQAEGTKLMTWVLEDESTPRPSKYVSDLMNTLLKRTR